MSISSIVTRGYNGGIQFVPTRGYSSGAVVPHIIGGHFLPATNKRKRTLSNILTIYDKAKDLPRKETKALRDAVREFVPVQAALIATVPDIAQVDYAALAANDAAYAKFSLALDAIQHRIEEMERNKIAILAKQQQEDDELLLITIFSCLIH